MNVAKEEIKRFGRHGNAFGFIRLLFASLVIVSHTPELIDGNRGRELLTQTFGTISFGELAVDGFFIVSGYLIVGSFLSRPVVKIFLIKRLARIYPAFIMATLVCVFFVAPLAGATILDLRHSLVYTLRGALLLSSPNVPNVFAGTPYPVLNGAMWTISYEFRCYLLVLLLGVIGLLRRPWLVFALAVICMVGFEQTRFYGHSQHLRLFSIFLFGSLFFLWRDKIVYRPTYTVAAFVALVGLMFIPTLAEPAVATFGAYIVFSTATLGGSSIISRINNRDDISYGVYLYAWPIEKLILWYLPFRNPLLVGTMTLFAACGFGWMSWHGLEKRVMRRTESLGARFSIDAAVAKLGRAVGVKRESLAHLESGEVDHTQGQNSASHIQGPSSL
jgi:peptidoglycan/LPS O-acetylase OafA/YrhL